jgi:hypothetical protein
MSNLIIDFFLRDPEIRLPGLSLKKLNGSNIWQTIYKDPDDGAFRIDSRYYIDGRTAKIEVEYLLGILKDLFEIIPFDGVKTKSNYVLSGDEIFNLIKK